MRKLICTVTEVTDAREKKKLADALFGAMPYRIQLYGAWIQPNGEAIWQSENFKVVSVGREYITLDDTTRKGGLKAKPDPDAPDWSRPEVRFYV